MRNRGRPRNLTRSRALTCLVAFLTGSAGYLYAFPQPNIFYAAVVLLHVLGGVVATFFLLFLLAPQLQSLNLPSRLGWILLTTGTLAGLVLIKTGTPRAQWNLMYLHIALSLAGVGLLLTERARSRGWLARGLAGSIFRYTICLLSMALVVAGARYLRESRWRHQARIENPSMPPASMDGEGDGPSGPFFPSSAQVFGGQNIPSKFFMESESCKRCHQDIYNQWFSSAHHFSSFNNQWYRKSIEYMQDTIGTRPSKWCGGCHDPAVLYSGLMDTPIKQIVRRPESQAGLGCMMCHSIAAVKSTMGQGDFYLEYPKLHEMAAATNPLARLFHDFLVKLNPEPHRRVFLKPFMREQTAEFCSTCHKVHLDVPVNHYRWIRGFNEYDNWQASGISGQGARSFYYPAQPSQCADCHMPLTPSSDFGNLGGVVHSHRFPGANTALPTANGDSEQLKATEDFLQNNILSVDIFALAREPGALQAGVSTPPELATSFAVGEEAETNVTSVSEGEASSFTAPLNRMQATVRQGDTVRVDVVVRTKKIGHFFPGGTVDAYDTWLELKATDEQGKTIFWSGMVEEGGKGPVEKGAHFYRSLQLDAHGNRINKRNAWATRAVLYVHLIPPGAADTVHYRLQIPANASGQVTLHARLCYRKFSWWNTQFSFAGVPEASGEVAADYDDRKFAFTGSLRGVSAREEKIPDLPIVVLAEDEARLIVIPHNVPAPEPKTILQAADWQRWNDYGIGLFLQGDLKAARAAFEKATEADSGNPDGWVNLGRVAVQEGDMDRASTVLKKALSLSPDLARAHFFYARVLRSEGRYDEAALSLRTVLAQYPRDRVVLNDLGRILFLQRKYADGVKTLQGVLAIDPEDLQAHYNLMLCYSGLGDSARAREHQIRYLRFKADESAQAITGPYRQGNPEDNNERQAIHEHVSVRLPIVGSAHARTGDRAHLAKPSSTLVHSGGSK